MACPFCGGEDWHGWDERVALEHVAGRAAVDRGMEAFPLTCANCGFIRLHRLTCSMTRARRGRARRARGESSRPDHAVRGVLDAGCRLRGPIETADALLPLSDADE
jgi:hypothetical protein